MGASDRRPAGGFARRALTGTVESTAGDGRRLAAGVCAPCHALELLLDAAGVADELGVDPARVETLLRTGARVNDEGRERMGTGEAFGCAKGTYGLGLTAAPSGRCPPRWVTPTHLCGRYVDHSRSNTPKALLTATIPHPSLPIRQRSTPSSRPGRSRGGHRRLTPWPRSGPSPH